MAGDSFADDGAVDYTGQLFGSSWKAKERLIGRRDKKMLTTTIKPYRNMTYCDMAFREGDEKNKIEAEIDILGIGSKHTTSENVSGKMCNSNCKSLRNMIK